MTKTPEGERNAAARSLRDVVCQDWTESERGLGTRPDGCSLHKILADRDAFVKDYWDSMPDEVPDEYSRPEGSPYALSVPKKTYDEIDGNGLWLSQAAAASLRRPLGQGL